METRERYGALVNIMIMRQNSETQTCPPPLQSPTTTPPPSLSLVVILSYIILIYFSVVTQLKPITNGDAAKEIAIAGSRL